MIIRPMTSADHPAVLALNEANVPDVGPMDGSKLDLLSKDSPFSLVVEDPNDQNVVGMLIGLVGGSVYPSPNYLWFAERHGDDFAYVDRVALAPAARGQGLGVDLYQRFEQWAQNHHLGLLCAEVNTVPPNPRSAKFHEAYGFSVVEVRRPYGSAEEVAMYEKPILPATGAAG